MTKNNIELLFESAIDSIKFLEAIIDDKKISERIRNLLKPDLSLIKDLMNLKYSGVTNPGVYLMFSNSLSGIAYRLGSIETMIIHEVSASEVEFVKKMLIATKILICYMDINCINNF